MTGWRARYTGPDAQRHPKTFGDKMAAEAWLNAERILIDRREWKPPKVREREEHLARRFSLGYPACPEMEDRRKVVELLRPEQVGGDAAG